MICSNIYLSTWGIYFSFLVLSSVSLCISIHSSILCSASILPQSYSHGWGASAVSKPRKSTQPHDSKASKAEIGDETSTVSIYICVCGIWSIHIYIYIWGRYEFRHIIRRCAHTHITYKYVYIILHYMHAYLWALIPFSTYHSWYITKILNRAFFRF